MAEIRENSIERYLLSQCRAHSFLCLKFISPARGAVPDRIIITPGGTVFVEVKRPGEEPTARQLATHAKMRRFGAKVYVVDSRPAVDRLIQLLSLSGTDAGSNSAEAGDGAHGAANTRRQA